MPTPENILHFFALVPKMIQPRPGAGMAVSYQYMLKAVDMVIRIEGFHFKDFESQGFGPTSWFQYRMGMDFLQEMASTCFVPCTCT